MSEGLFNYEPEVSRECAAADHSRCIQVSCQCGHHRPVRPYTQDGEKSAGWSGTDTSKAAEPIRAASQQRVYAYVLALRSDGATVKEVRDATYMHHGVASGALSVLHKKGNLLRLLEKRDKCRVYVHPTYLAGRDHD